MGYVLMFFLLGSTLFDLKDKMIPVVWIWGSIVVMFIYRLYLLISGNCEFSDMVYALLPGLVFYLFSKVSSDMGEADGLQMLSTGCYFSGKEHMEMLIGAFFTAAIASGVIMVFEKNCKNRRIAFVPFLFIASGVSLYLQ